MMIHPTATTKVIDEKDEWIPLLVEVGHPPGGLSMMVSQGKSWVGFDQEMAANLWPLLKVFAETGQLPDASPPSAAAGPSGP